MIERHTYPMTLVLRMIVTSATQIVKVCLLLRVLTAIPLQTAITATNKERNWLLSLRSNHLLTVKDCSRMLVCFQLGQINVRIVKDPTQIITDATIKLSICNALIVICCSLNVPNLNSSASAAIDTTATCIGNARA